MAESEEALGFSLWRHSLEDKQMGSVTFRLLLAWAIEHSKGKIFAQKAEDKQMGGVTFRLLLAWTIEHSKGKILAQKAGKGYKE